jgi:hypothetical protein
LCWDNNYVKNKANADDETKKRFNKTKKHGPNQYAMLKRSYKPINQEARNNVNVVNFTPQQQWQKTLDQLFLHLGDFMKGEIETMTKTADKKNANQINIKLLNSANEAAACLVELANKDRHKKFSWLKKCKHTRENKFQNKKRDLPMKVVKTTMTMMNRCQKQLDFKLNIYCVSLSGHINN